MYRDAIIEATKRPEDADAIEEVMRLERPTLDALTRGEFDRLARKSARALDEIRRADAEWDDAELAAWEGEGGHA